MHVVQLTPRGSGGSIVFGDLRSQREMAPGSMKGLQSAVSSTSTTQLQERVAHPSRRLQVHPWMLMTKASGSDITE
jgi:hypothetical protein